MTDTTQHFTAAQFLAQRQQAAQTVEVQAPKMVALPGALAPIPADRLEAHQEDGLSMHEIVQYENKHFLETNVRVRERHAHWVNRDYNAMVQVHQEAEAQKRAQEMQASARYQQRLGEILAGKDAADAE